MNSLPAALGQAFSQSDPALDPELLSGEASLMGPNVSMALLSDKLGHVQAIYPVGCLLDIDSLNEALGRELAAVPLAEHTRLRNRMQMASIPAVPALTGFETVLDNRVAQCDPIYLDSGLPDTLLRLSRAGYCDLTAEARRLDFAIPLTDIAVNFSLPEHDGTQLNRALQRFTTLRIRQRLEDTLELPPLPETAQRIIHLRVNPNAEVGDLADVVESDPSLAAQVVSWANSSFYAAPGQVRSIYDAIMRVLGFELVMNLAMGLSLGRTLKQPKEDADGVLDYWRQAIWIAQAAGLVTSLMPRNRRPSYGLAYLAGLLHNFGYLVLAHVFPPHLKLIRRYCEANREVDPAYIEHHLLGITREQIAGQLMERWGMPDEIITALRYQKSVDYRGLHSDYPLVLSLSRQLLIARGIPVGAPEPVLATTVAELGLNADELAEGMDALVANRNDIHTMADMLRGG